MAGSGGVADAVGGLLYGNPGYNSAPIDQGTKDLMTKQVGDSTSKTAQDYANDTLHGTGSQFNNPQGQQFHSALGGATDPQMQAALQARGQRAMDFDVNQLQKKAQLSGIGQQASRLQDAMSGIQHRQEVENRSNQAQIQAWQNNQKLRGSIISGLFGGAGQAFGMMSGGGGGGGSGTSPVAGSDWSGGSSQIGSNNFGDANSGW